MFLFSDALTPMMMPCRTTSGAVLKNTCDLRIGNRTWFLLGNALTQLADDDALTNNKWSLAEENSVEQSWRQRLQKFRRESELKAALTLQVKTTGPLKFQLTCRAQVGSFVRSG